MIDNPEIIYNPADGTVKLKIKPIAGKVGKVVFVLEAKEKNGIAIKQATFKVKVARIPTSVNYLSSGSTIKVFPNQASDKLYLDCKE